MTELNELLSSGEGTNDEHTQGLTSDTDNRPGSASGIKNIGKNKKQIQQ